GPATVRPRPHVIQRGAWYHAKAPDDKARKSSWSVDESRGRSDRGLQTAPGGRGAGRRGAARMGTRLRPRAEAGTLARIPEGPRAALAREGAFLRRRAP